MRDEITYNPFPNFKWLHRWILEMDVISSHTCTVEIWKWRINFIANVTGRLADYLSMLGLKLIHVCKSESTNEVFVHYNFNNNVPSSSSHQHLKNLWKLPSNRNNLVMTALPTSLPHQGIQRPEMTHVTSYIWNVMKPVRPNEHNKMQSGAVNLTVSNSI